MAALAPREQDSRSCRAYAGQLSQFGKILDLLLFEARALVWRIAAADPAEVFLAQLKRQFDCFDRLPPKLRDALANAAFDWDATLIAEVLDLGTAADALAARIAEDDRRRLPVDNYVMYGPDHPGAASHVPANTLKFYRYPARAFYWWARS